MKPILLVLMALVVFNAGCSRKGGPGEKAKEGLSEAREGIAQVREGVDLNQDSMEALRERREALRQDIEQQEAQLSALIDKRLELLRRQIDALGQQVRRLPAERESSVRTQLAQLSQKRDDVAAKLKAYRDAPAEKSAQALQQLDGALAQFQTGYKQVEADINGSDAAPGK